MNCLECPVRFNDGNYLPDREHPFNVGACPDCHWDVHGPEIDTPAIHFACDMNRQLNKEAA